MVPRHNPERRKTMMNYAMTAQLNNGSREELNQPEFVGEGIHTIADAIDAAKDAIEYAEGSIEYVDLYLDDYGYIGYVDGCGKFVRDCDCDIDLD
jgi:hypothetical protein